MPNWASWLPAAVLSLGCVVTLAVDRQERMTLALPLDSIPVALAGRSGTTAEIPTDQQEAAGMSAYLFRYFPGEVAPFDIYVGYYDQQTQGKTIHSPKNCLPGSGWEALQQTTTVIATASGPATVNRYLLQNKQQRALVFYWYQGRGRVAANEYQVKWELLRDAALRGRTEESLVRIVVRLNEQTTEAAAAEVAAQVAAGLIPAVGRVMPAW
jgi:EpsI family protein